MSRRWRATRYGASIALALIGAICGAVIPGTLGGTLATLLIGIGLVGVLSLVFYEIGLSEDRDRARRSRDRSTPPGQPARSQTPRRRRPTVPDRLRGERRRLR